VPPVEVLFIGNDRQQLGRSVIDVSSNRMLPGEVLRFSERLENPPRAATRFDVSFAQTP